MPRYEVTSPDGKRWEVEAPDGATQDQVLAYAQQQWKAPEQKGSGIAQGLGNLAAGAVRGAGSIGATLLAPFDVAKDALAGKGLSLESNRERRKAMDEGLGMMGAETDSLLYKGGKLAGEIAGTAGAGGAVANVLGRTGMVSAPALAAIRTSGFTAPGAGIGTRMAGGAVTGAASAGLVNPEDAGMGAMVGGVLPGATKLAGMAGRGVGNALRGPAVTPEVAALAKRAATLGIDIPADRIAQSKPLDALASGLNYVPFSGRAGTEARMSEQLNRALSKTFGQDSSNVTQALRKADGVLGAKFDSFLRSNTVRVDQRFMEDLADAANMALKELPGDQAKVIGNQVDEIIAKAGSGAIDGQAAYNIKRTLDRIGARNSPEAWYALDLKKKLMEALNRSVGQAEAKGFAELRQQYGAMLDLQKLAKNGAEGEISVARLANMKNIRNPQMQELADIAAQFVKPREGQHGAMQRAVVGPGAAAAAGPGGLLGGAAVGRGLNAALNSNAARGLLLGEPVPMGLLGNPALQQLGYRSAPLLMADQ